MFSPAAKRQLAQLLAPQRSGSYELLAVAQQRDQSSEASWRPESTKWAPEVELDANNNNNNNLNNWKLNQPASRSALRLAAKLRPRSSSASYCLNTPLTHQIPPAAHSNGRHEQEGVTLCTLGVGTTFGASVMPGKAHSVSAVTSDDCTLLRVRRADFQEIFNEQAHLISDVESSPFCSFTSLNRPFAGSAHQQSVCGKRLEAPERGLQPPQRSSTSSGASSLGSEPSGGRQLPNGLLVSGAQPIQASAQQQQPQQQQQQQQQEAAAAAAKQSEEQEAELGADELNLDAIDAQELSSHLMRIGWVLRTLILAQNPHMIQNRRIHAHLLQQHHHHRHQPSRIASAGSLRRQSQRSQHHTKQLVSTGSSSQLLVSGSSSQSASLQAATSQSSAPKSAASKVANYVASSFMRAGGAAKQQQQQQQQQPQVVGKPAAPLNSVSPSHALFTSNSFDANLVHQAQTQPQLASSKQLGEPFLFKRSMLGAEMVDWLLTLSQSSTSASRFVSSRLQAVSVWQVLLEQGIVFSFTEPDALVESGAAPAAGQPTQRAAQQNCCQFHFCDDQQAYYKFWFDREGTMTAEQSSGGSCGSSSPERPSESDLRTASESLWWSLKVLGKLAPDAGFRLILSKRPHERSFEEVDIVFEELQHLKALSHLTNSVKKELAACVTSEYHVKQNTVIFNQGDVGQCWYIILRGSVNVIIVGKGVVCTLHDGDDFGKLALVNDAPRAATIVTNEPNCYFLRVDKHDFNTILRDVEANTVRLKEHGKEVLILQKVAVREPLAAQAADQLQQSQWSLSSAAQAADAQPAQQPGLAQAAAQTQLATQPNAQQLQQSSASQLAAQQAANSTSQPGATQPASATAAALKYMVMAGTGEKMLEHLLETRIDGHTQTKPLLTPKAGLMQHDQVAGFIQCHGDNFLEDFILTHRIFMPTSNLCGELLKQYQCQTKPAAQQQQQQASNANAQQASLHGEHAALDEDYLIAKKRRVVKFVRCWMLITREHFFQQQQIQSFLTTIHQKIKQDATRFSSLQPELKALARILELHLEEENEARHRGVQHWIDDVYGNILPIRRHSGAWELNQAASLAQGEQFLASLHQRRFELKLSTMQAEDEVVFRVYCADHSFATLKCRVDEKAANIKQLAAQKLNLDHYKELILAHVKSNGQRIIYNDLEFNISTSLSVNGRIFVCPLDHIDAISPLPEQDPFQEVYQSLALVGAAPGEPASNSQALQNSQPAQTQPSYSTAAAAAAAATAPNQMLNQQQSAPTEQGSAQTNSHINSHLLSQTPTSYADIKTQMSLSVSKLEEFSSRDVAYCLTQLAWALLKNMHEFELIYTVFGRHNFKGQITANLNVFLRHFNEIQYWVVTEICLSSSLSKRVQILRKFIKIAAHCKDLQNLNAFFAIIMGLSNMAVARLTQTWERLPSKLKRTFSQFESLIDPSRNHRRYRIFISKMEPPIIPFMPLFLKDMTFAHEGNKTYLENGLINFEKMQLVAQTLRTIRYCKSRPMKLDTSVCKFKGSIRSIELFFRDLKIIDNQRTLTQMSHQLEHRKT